MLWTVLLVILVVVAIIWTAWRRGLQLRALVEGGIAGKATVAEKWNHTGSNGVATGRLRYAFIAANGRRYQRTVPVTADEGGQYDKGDEIDIVYLHGRPQVSAMASMVAQARTALNKKAVS